MSKNCKVSQYADVEFCYLLQIDPKLEEWREMAASYLRTKTRSMDTIRHALNKFIGTFIPQIGFKFPAEFLDISYDSPSFYDSMPHLVQLSRADYNNMVVEFLDWVLENRFSAEDDYGRKTISPGFANPLKPVKKSYNVETNKAALPHRYIKELREIVCPKDAKSFRDWTWAMENSTEGTNGGEWFEVDRSVVDENDPDCVWRRRMGPVYQNNESKTGNVVGKREIFELWSPVRWVVMYVKLELPLRTSQICWLESGEADTFRFEQGQWVRNTHPIVKGTEKHPYQKGVFRRSFDMKEGKSMCSLFINTNKTADIEKSEDAKGYVVPWEHPRVIPWLERLRNWQMKYNPIKAPVRWRDLKKKHTGALKHPEILAEMGEACFLFRDASAKNGDDVDKPIASKLFAYNWRVLLEELERRCEVRNEVLKGKQKIRFVKSDSRTATYFPLHSLRVSLITLYALDGGVSMAVLSKCIAGHARIIMTLYYTKAGIGRVTEVMEEAERKILAKDKESYQSFLTDATYKQIEQASAFNDPVAIQAVLDNRSPAGWVVEDKGICPLGCGSCDKGFLLQRQGKDTPDIVPVPGYPREKNCVRCRFFLSGPAFLDGLIDHFNSLSYQMSESSERYNKLGKQVEALEDEQIACTEQELPFTKGAEFQKLSRVYEIEAEKCDKVSADWGATARLVKRSIEIMITKKDVQDDKLSLVAVGSMEDLQSILIEVSELHQLQVLCDGATVYAETDATKAVLRRSQTLDFWLEGNGLAPMFFKLPVDLQHQFGNEIMNLLKLRMGSIKGAVDVVEGLKSLESLGMLGNVTELLEKRTGMSLKLNGTKTVDIPCPVELLPTGTGGY